MDEAVDIDVERIRQRIREKIRRRRELPALPDPGLPPLNEQVAADITTLYAIHDVSAAPLTSHRRLLGPAVLLVKKTLRALMTPILGRQTEYNVANARVVSALWRWTEWVAREQTAMLHALHRQLSGPAVDTGVAHARIEELERVVAELRQDIARLDRGPVASAGGPAPTPGEGVGHRLDALYLALEDEFRGSREDVKARVAVYLPYVRRAPLGGDATTVLDVGCGRGEWLELLRSHGVQAQGVESNRSMLDECRRHDLAVIEGDGVSGLRNLASASLGVVTGFHLVEHLPFDALVELLDETVRVLRPGGLAIFETPDPENLLVASHAFHLDPTHRHPLPSALMKFLVEARGLGRVEILKLHALPDAVGVKDDRSEVAKRFNEHFYGPRDYAVIGWKP